MFASLEANKMNHVSDASEQGHSIKEYGIKMIKLGIVILNYLQYAETIECVESILKQTCKDCHIIIVDNGSSNGSYEALKQKYEKKAIITIIRTAHNLGFSKGSNEGIKYARNALGCDSIFLLNSDTVLEQNVLCQILNSKISDDVAVISPAVYRADGKPQPPSVNCDEIAKFTLRACCMIVLTSLLHMPIIKHVYAMYQRNKIINKATKYNQPVNYKKYIIQGSAFILTPTYFRYYTQLYPETFLYWEEINLMWYLKKTGLKSIAINTSPVVHKGAKSADIYFGNNDYTFRKFITIYKGMFKSIPLFFMDYELIKQKYGNRGSE